ncbi:MAG: hypothetical protein PW792_05355 [Acidobacteriaceae bacterium]|nr:hypothetical protein [Acidobacteriaceae bacterium]
MRKLSRWVTVSSFFVIPLFLGCSHREQDRATTAVVKTPELYFFIRPTTQLFSMGEPVTFGFQLYSRSEQPILASLQGNDFVHFKVTGPDGTAMRWQGKTQADPKVNAAADLTVLKQYQAISTTRAISLKDGTGFAFDKPGEYTLLAEFSMGPPESFARFSGQAKPAVGTFPSSKLKFCIEACIVQDLTVHPNSPEAAIETIRKFYAAITKYRPLGIPSGKAKTVLWPLLSKRLVQEIDGLAACDRGYYRRYGKILLAETSKPATPWLEEGLFTGPNDAATPPSFRIVSSRAVGENRVDALLAFKEDWGDSEGNVTAILENGHWVIDDYIAMYGNDELLRLSAGYSECKDGRWVGEPAY